MANFKNHQQKRLQKTLFLQSKCPCFAATSQNFNSHFIRFNVPMHTKSHFSHWTRLKIVSSNRFSTCKIITIILMIKFIWCLCDRSYFTIVETIISINIVMVFGWELKSSKVGNICRTYPERQNPRTNGVLSGDGRIFYGMSLYHLHNEFNIMRVYMRGGLVAR